MMRVAIPHWQGRISPVLDTASHCLLIDMTEGIETDRQDIRLMGEGPQLRADGICRLGVDVLICGAVSRPLERALQAGGIEVRPHVCGAVELVLRALLDGRLEEDTFLMPGCCGRRRQGRRHRGGRCQEPREP